MNLFFRRVLFLLLAASHCFASDRSWELLPQVSVISPSEFVLTNNDFAVPYSTLLAGLPAFYMGISTPIKKVGDLQISALGRVGYAYKAGNYTLSSRGGEQRVSHLTLSWLPVSIGAIAEYEIPGFPFIKPALTIGGGAEWMRQTGTLQGLTTDFWLPYFYVSQSIGFFEGTSSIDWFGGFAFGITYQDSIVYLQRARAWSFDLSATVLF